MQCPSCQATLPEAAKFCIECGARAPSVCDTCGFANVAGARFCAQCGNRLPVAAAEWHDRVPADAHRGREDDTGGERRQLTAMFCDLVGSTPLTSRLDPEDLGKVIGAYHRCIAETIERFGGYVARYMGDGALIYFGYPQGHEDNAERAVRAALALVWNVTALNVLGEQLRLRIGVATGPVVIGELVSAGATREKTVLGETLNLAARLQAFADPNAIVIAESTRRLVGALFECRDLGEITLAGFAAPMRAWQVLREERSLPQFRAYDSRNLRQDTASYAVESGPLVGRVEELRLLCDYWKQVREGRGRIVVVQGEPGIGKSRLLKAFSAGLEQEPHAYLGLSCSAQYDNSPLYPVSALLPAVMEWGRHDAPDVRLEKLEAFCARHKLPTREGVTLLAPLLSLPASERFPAPAMSPERQRQRTLEILAAIPLSFAAEKPLIIVVEDLQWIDPTSRQLLDMIADQVPTVPIFLLVAARLDFEAHWQAQSYLTTITLSGLGASEVEELAKRLAGSEPFPDEIVDEIVAKTDGVPLFVEELVKEVRDGLTPSQEHRYVLTGPLSPLAIPTTLQDLLAARLDHLGSFKALAQLCATLGREFSFPLLKAVSVADDATLERSLARLVHAEFLHQRGTSIDAVYIFKHVMIQEAAYQSLLKSRRQQYHERIARVLVEQFALDAEQHPEVVAVHYARAANVYSAIGWWQKAGQRAFRRASYAESIAHYSNGLRALGSTPPDRRRSEAELSLQVELGYSLIPLRGWGATETAAAFSRARELCQELGDTPSRFRALWGVGAFHFVRGDQHKTREIAEQCLDLARQVNDEDALIEAHYLMGVVHCVRGDFLQGCASLETCIRLYGPLPRETHRFLYGQDAKASALGWIAMALWVLGRPDDALARAKEAVDFVRDTTQPFLRARSLAAVGFVRLFRGEPQGAEMELPAALALCAEQQFNYFHAIVATFQGANLVLLGKPHEGIRLMQEHRRSLRSMGAEVLATLVHRNLASAELALDHVDEALSVTDEGLAYVERNDERWAESELLRLRGQLLGMRGADPDRAEDCLQRALEVAREQQAKAYELRAATALARHWLARGKREDARTLLTRTLEHGSAMIEGADWREARALFDLG